MSATLEATSQSTVLAIYPDHEKAENAVRFLQKAGLPMEKLSIIGKDFQTIEHAIGFVTTSSIANDSARVGAWTGGIFGLLVGAAFLIVPGLGPLVIIGPFAATLLGGVEGAIAGGALGGLTGALISLGVTKNQAIRYESELRAGKFLVTLHGDATLVEKAEKLLSDNLAEATEVVTQKAN